MTAETRCTAVIKSRMQDNRCLQCGVGRSYAGWRQCPNKGTCSRRIQDAMTLALIIHPSSRPA